MADPQSYRPKTSDIPAKPGVYRFIDGEDRVIYVGKAKSLRSRLVNYFQPLDKLHPRTRAMVTTAVRVIWVVVADERAALTLEYQWIKEFTPRFNVIFRDDKSYPYLAVTMAEEYPRLMGTRAAHKKGNRYFGPYTKGSIKDSVDLLLKVFPIRSCSKGTFNQAQRAGRPCLNGYIDRCAAPCIGRISAEQHRRLAGELVDFLDSDGSQLVSRKKSQMLDAASRQEYEQAARLRDDVQALQAVVEKNTMVLDQSADADVFGLERDELEASVQVFYVRAGRVRGQRGWVSEIEDVSESELIEELLIHVYGDGAAAAHQADVMPSRDVRDLPQAERDSARVEPELAHIEKDSDQASGISDNSRASIHIKTAPSYVDDTRHTATAVIPKEIWVPALPSNKGALEEWLSDMRGGSVHIKVPQRGSKAEFMQTVHENARLALMRHKLTRVGDLTQRSAALEQLREGLGLPRVPLRIECFDISHTQGTYQVASMVVFEDGLAKKSDYRSFIIRGEDGEGATDDTAAMAEVLRRRLSRLAQGARPDDASDDNAELAATHSPRRCGSESGGETLAAAHPPRRFAYRPDLIVVDGGLPQVNAAQKVVSELGADVSVIGLAKRLEEVWLPEEEFPLILPRQSAALHLLQYVRDESHRFAITLHRKKRSQAMTRSALDTIPGLGPAKQKALLKEFGSLAQIRKASERELQRVPGIGPAMAQTLIKSFSSAPPSHT